MPPPGPGPGPDPDPDPDARPLPSTYVELLLGTPPHGPYLQISSLYTPTAQGDNHLETVILSDTLCSIWSMTQDPQTGGFQSIDYIIAWGPEQFARRLQCEPGRDPVRENGGSLFYEGQPLSERIDRVRDAFNITMVDRSLQMAQHLDRMNAIIRDMEALDQRILLELTPLTIPPRSPFRDAKRDAELYDEPDEDAANVGPTDGDATDEYAVDEYAVDEYAADEYTMYEYTTDEYTTDEYAVGEYTTDEYTMYEYTTDEEATDEEATG